MLPRRPLRTVSEADTLGVAQVTDLSIPPLLEARWSGSSVTCPGQSPDAPLGGQVSHTSASFPTPMPGKVLAGAPQTLGTN